MGINPDLVIDECDVTVLLTGVLLMEPFFIDIMIFPQRSCFPSLEGVRDQVFIPITSGKKQFVHQKY
jgi:hypothetical protein